MSIKAFFAHLGDKHPAFECEPALGQGSGAFIASVYHELADPASAAALEMLRAKAGDWADALMPIYQQHDGMRLYCGPGEKAGGFQFLPISKFDETLQAAFDWKEEMGEQEEIRQAFSGVAFAETPESGNYWILKVDGPHAGSVVHADHEDWTEEPFAPSIGAMLRRMYTDPAKFLYDIGYFCRYSDGSSKTQWIPRRYIPNATK